MWRVLAVAHFGPDGRNFSADVIADITADLNGILRLCPCGSNVSASLRLEHGQKQMQ